MMMTPLIRRPQRRVRPRASSTTVYSITVYMYTCLLSIYKMLLGRPGPSKIIHVAIPPMWLVGFGATKMAPQGTISLFHGLCEPFLYAKFRNFGRFLWFSRFSSTIRNHFGAQNRFPDDMFACLVWKNWVVHAHSTFWWFFGAKHRKVVDTRKSRILENNWFT